jgi:alkane 1-monooxygenase
MGGSNMNVAHELFHKDNIIDKIVGTLTLARNMYMHFTIEHIFGHHKSVATPRILQQRSLAKQSTNSI